jgi:hypothetical protein
LWLAASGRGGALVCEQFLAMLFSAIANNLILAHFAIRAAGLTPPDEKRATALVQLSMSPRRLRDHTNPWVELAVVLPILLALWLARGAHAVAGEPWVTWDAGAWLRSIDHVMVWILYLEAGLLFLKVVFVRWRMPLPLARTEDFRRWRTAWLSYYLRLFDGARLLLALALVSVIFWLTRGRGLGTSLAIAFGIALFGFAADQRSQERRLSAIAREAKPHELLREFPAPRLAEGRFLGLFCLSSGNPGVLLRSPRGLALNLAHPTTYAWASYLMGLVALTVWAAR